MKTPRPYTKRTRSNSSDSSEEYEVKSNLNGSEKERTPKRSPRLNNSDSINKSNKKLSRTLRSSNQNSPSLTPKVNMEFSRELKQILNDRNMLTTKTKKKVFDALTEIETSNIAEGNKRKRENVIFEILVSEKTYVNQLSIIINFFMKPCKEKKILNNIDYEVLFGNIQTIYNINDTLLKELFNNSSKVANAFSKIAPYFKLYSSYALGFKSSLNLLQKMKIKNLDFYKFMESQETRPEVENKLSALLIAPIQRIPKYKLLLQQLLDYTMPTNEDYESIRECLEKVSDAAKHINKSIQEQENAQKLLELQRSFKNGEFNIITPGRILLKQGILSEFTRQPGRHSRFNVVLLNDIILICKILTYNKNPLKVKAIFPLKKVTIKENYEKGCFQIQCENEEYNLFDNEVTITKEWVESIKKAIDDSIENRKTLRKESSARRPVKRKDLNSYSDTGISPGVPLQKRRRTIEEEIKECSYEPSSSRMLRSMTPSLIGTKKTLEPIRIRSKSIPRTMTTESLERNTIEVPDTDADEECKDVFVFGKNNQNPGFTFRLTNVLSNIGSSIKNLFTFRR